MGTNDGRQRAILRKIARRAMVERGLLPDFSCEARNDELKYLAQHCTEQEVDANKVERLVRKAAAALLLESRIGHEFEAMVTGASEKGTWVRLFDPPVEGKVQEGFKGLDVGDILRVRLTGTDVERGYIDFARTSLTRAKRGRLRKRSN